LEIAQLLRFEKSFTAKERPTRSADNFSKRNSATGTVHERKSLLSQRRDSNVWKKPRQFFQTLEKREIREF
jgi:hypothetical protein